MYTLYPSAHAHPYPQHHPSYYYDDDYLARDYFHTLAQHQARERHEAQRQAQLEMARRRRAYQEQLARRRYEPFINGFNREPYSNYSRSIRHGEDEYSSLPDDIWEQPARRPSGKEKSAINIFPTYTPSSHKVPSEPEEVETKTCPATSSVPDVLRDTAARKIQSFVRVQLPRLAAFRAISIIAGQFEDAKRRFEFPASLDFTDSQTDAEIPALLFTPRNAPLHAHEHTLGELLSSLDAVDSHGDRGVRRARKQLVRRIEGELEALDLQKADVWRQSRKEDARSAFTEEPVVGIDNTRKSEEVEPVSSIADSAKPTPESGVLSEMELEESTVVKEILGEQDSEKSMDVADNVCTDVMEC